MKTVVPAMFVVVSSMLFMTNCKKDYSAFDLPVSVAFSGAKSDDRGWKCVEIFSPEGRVEADRPPAFDKADDIFRCSSSGIKSVYKTTYRKNGLMYVTLTFMFVDRVTSSSSSSAKVVDKSTETFLDENHDRVIEEVDKAGNPGWDVKVKSYHM